LCEIYTLFAVQRKTVDVWYKAAAAAAAAAAWLPTDF
jgi:hypothetical protein